MRQAVSFGLLCAMVLAGGTARAEITYERLSLSGDKSVLVVKGARAVARNKTSSGIASFTMTWDPATQRITAENSKVIATDKGQKAPVRLIKHWYAENDECRGGTEPESAKTKRACERRSELDAKLDRVGWCYGHRNEYGYQMQWHACDINSNRP